MKDPSLTRLRGGRFMAVLALVLSAGTEASADGPFRWALQPGESLRYEFHQSNEITIKAGGQETASTTDLTFGLTWKVKAVSPAGKTEIVMLVNNVRAEIRSGASKFVYDSRKEKPTEDAAAKPLEQVYTPAVGAEYSLTIDARGRITKAKVPEAVTTALRSSPFMAVADGGSIFTEDGLKNMLGQVLPLLPEREVRKGDTWRSQLTLPTSPLVTTLDIAYRLDSLEPGSASIVATLDSKVAAEPGTPFTVSVKGQSGTASFAIDRNAGRLKSSQINQKIVLGLLYMNRELEQSIKITEQFTLVP